MSDTGLTTNTAPVADSPPDVPAPATPSPVDSAPPAGMTDDDVFAAPPDDQAVFSRSYVDKIRTDGARYRTEANSVRGELDTYNQVFSQYPDEDRQVWFDLARDWATDPVKAAQVMQTIATGVLGEMQQQQPEEPTKPMSTEEPPPPAAITPESVQEMIANAMAAQQQSATEAQAVKDVFDEVRTAGYDPESAEGFSVLYNANHFTNGNISEAVKMVKARDQKVIDDYVAGRQGRPMVAPSNGVQATAAPGEIRNIDDARKATEAWLRSRQTP